jgi:hypothetical protein
MNPSQRSMRARLAAHTRWAREPDPRAATEAGRQAFLARLERDVDPAGVLPPEERAIRAEHALKAHMLAMALKRHKRR